MLLFEPLKIKYDFIIPLGEECYTSESIDSKFNIAIRKLAFPFDYVGHTFIETIQKKLENIIFNNESLLEKNDIEIKLFGDKYFYVDSKYGLNYWHDTTYKDYSLFTDEDLNNFFDKYKRRYERLIDIVKGDNKIIFISVNHYDNVYKNIEKKEELNNLYNILIKINKNILLLAFNYEKSNYHIDNLFHINLEFDNNLPFDESKNIFKKNLFNYMNTYIKLL